MDIGYVYLKIEGKRYKADSLYLINDNIILFRSTRRRPKKGIRAETFALLLKDMDCNANVYFQIDEIVVDIDDYAVKNRDIVLNGKIVPTFNGAISMG